MIILDPTTGETETLTCYPNPTERDSGVRTATPSWSPDGSMLVWAAIDPVLRRHELWVIDRGTGSHSVIWQGALEYETEAWSPTWSADGRYIAYTLADKPPVEVWRLKHPLLKLTSTSPGPRQTARLSE